MAVLAEHRHPDRDRDPDPRVAGGHAHPAGAGPQPFGDHVGVGVVGAGQQDGELLPAEPAHHVRLTDLLPELGGQRPQHLVPDQVAVVVVDPLEVVDVHKQQRQRGAGPKRPGDLAVSLALPGGGVQQPGLRVGAGRSGQLLMHQAPLQQDDRRQRDQQKQVAEHAGDRHEDADAGFGQVEQQGFGVPEHLLDGRLGFGQVRRDRDRERVDHGEHDRAGDRGQHHGRPGQPGRRAGERDERGVGNDQVKRGRGGGARQPEGRRAEHPAVDGYPAGAQVQHGADGERRNQGVQRWQQQRDRQPPGGKQVPRYAGGLAEPPHRLDADHRGC